MKCISIALSKEIQLEYENDITKEDGIIDIFLNENDYNALWDTNFFHEVNEKLDLLIDDFEEEDVSGQDKLRKLYEIILDYEEVIDNPIIYTLKSLTKQAIRVDSAIYFFF